MLTTKQKDNVQIKLISDAEYQGQVIDERQDKLDMIEQTFNDIDHIQNEQKIELVKQTEVIDNVVKNSDTTVENIDMAAAEVNKAKKKSDKKCVIF